MTKVSQLETRSSSRTHRWIHTELEEDSWLCESIMVSDTDIADQLSSRGNENCSVENPTLVSSHVVGHPSSAATEGGPIIEWEFIMPSGVPQLAAWPLSGNSADREAFQQQLCIWSQHPCDSRQHHHMNLSLGNGTADVWNRIEIPLRPYSRCGKFSCRTVSSGLSILFAEFLQICHFLGLQDSR